MPLDPGTRLGPYEILSRLGAGGMGEVFRARDPRLDRQVAIKVSQEQFSMRFEREAKSTAALNHPNICHLYDVGPNYLVMELIEGPTLAERIKEGALPVEEALTIGRQIADALDAAHEKGIVHRDLKPENIKIRPDGTVKVLDFGLSKLAESADPEPRAEGMTMTMGEKTQVGMVIGTPAYMSPEQARGRNTDKRTDIWAFGVVLYEMLTGDQMFQGQTLSDMLIEVATREPDLTKVPAKTRRLLQRCLAKDPRKRLRDIGDVWDLLEETPSAQAAVAVAAPPRAPRSTILPWAVAVVLLLAAGALGFQLWRASSRPGGVVQATVELAPADNLGSKSGRPFWPAVALSPDGNTVYFSGMIESKTAIFRRPLDQAKASNIPGTQGAFHPFLSPDGQWLGFIGAGQFRKMPVNGGPAVTICKLSVTPWGASWGTGGSIVYSEAGILKQVSADGGEPHVLLAPKPDAIEAYSAPEFLPNGKTVLFGIRRNYSWDDSEISVLAPGGAPRTVVKNGASPRYAGGYLFFMRRGTLLAAPFDVGKLAITGSPAAVLEGVMQGVNAAGANAESGIGQYAVSRMGTLVYAAGGINPPLTGSLVKLDRKGGVTDLNFHDVAYFGRISPDGQRLVAAKSPPDNSFFSDLELYDLARGTSTRLTQGGTSENPVWSPDGNKIVYSENKNVILLPVDGHGERETIVSSNDYRAWPASWSSDGQWLIYLAGADRSKEIRMRPMASGQAAEPKLFLKSNTTLDDAQLSPNAKWIAYRSNETGKSEIYVEAFPGGGGKQRISQAGGVNPAWAHSGRELFYLASNSDGNMAMMAVDVDTGDHFHAGLAHELFTLPDLAISAPTRSYDVYPDGQHFIALTSKPPAPTQVTGLRFALNWLDDVKKRVR